MNQNNFMNYKGYKALIEFSSEDECLVGHIIGIRDVVGFHGDSVESIKQEFKQAVDFYLESCEKMGISPDKPCSGHITLMISPDLHARLVKEAQESGESLNSFIGATLRKSLDNKICETN